jgi:hypothetical protein
MHPVETVNESGIEPEFLRGNLGYTNAPRRRPRTLASGQPNSGTVKVALTGKQHGERLLSRIAQWLPMMDLGRERPLGQGWGMAAFSSCRSIAAVPLPATWRRRLRGHNSRSVAQRCCSKADTPSIDLPGCSGWNAIGIIQAGSMRFVRGASEIIRALPFARTARVRAAINFHQRGVGKATRRIGFPQACRPTGIGANGR